MHSSVSLAAKGNSFVKSECEERNRSSVSRDRNEPRACAAASFSVRSVTYRSKLSYHQSLNVGSVHPPQTQGNVQSAMRLALTGRYLLQTEALIGLIDLQTI